VNAERKVCEERWHDEIAGYVLGALSPVEAERLERHMEGCPACAERADWLSPAVDVIPASVPQHDPPATLRARLMEVVNAEAAEAGAAAAPAPRRRRFSLPGLSGLSLRPALAGFAVVLLVVAGVVGYSLRGGDGVDSRTVEAIAAKPDASASGTVEVRGDSGTLSVENMPPAGDGEVYQAWLVRDGEVEPSSVFVLSSNGSGKAAIDHGLEGAEKLMITQEPEGGSITPEGAVMMSADLD
jgi:anti-sigma factor RsiW